MTHANELAFDLTIAKISRKTHVAAVSGDLDLHHEDELRRRLWPLANRRGTRLIVDLSAAPFVDSTAIGFLVGLAAHLRSEGGELVIASDDPRLQRILEQAGLLSVERSLAGAVERVGNGRAV